MASEWDAWLRALRAAGKGGRVLPSAIDRGLPFVLPVAIAYDVSADSFAAELRASPDAGGAALAAFSVSVGAYTDGFTVLTLSLTAAQTGALPEDSDLDGATELPFDILWTRGGTTDRLIGGLIPVIGKVTSYAG